MRESVGLIHWVLCWFVIVPALGQDSKPQPVTTQSTFTAEQLVKNIFVKGGCENVSNIKSIGSARGIGYFATGQDAVNLQNGIILSTGDISTAKGPNKHTDASGSFLDGTGDRDLGRLVNAPLSDVVGLEFDFTPLDSNVTFSYVFASEEYCEFAGSKYNDVFGFFISGPGINGEFSNGAINVARIPESEDYVSINRVNSTVNSQYFIANELPKDARACQIPHSGSTRLPFIEYDGFTKPLVARVKLIPCQTYHIRLVVGDAGDGFYDSAVFLEAGSFNIGGAITLDVSASRGNGKNIMEGCDSTFLVFQRKNFSDLQSALRVQYKVSSTSEALSGVDFSPLEGSVEIPAGKIESRIPLFVIPDTLAEGTERLTISLDIPCACYKDSITILIHDPPPLLIAADTAKACVEQPALLHVTAMQGVPP